MATNKNATNGTDSKGKLENKPVKNEPKKRQVLGHCLCTVIEYTGYCVSCDLLYCR